MAVFEITAYPAHVTPRGSVQVEVTRCVYRAKFGRMANEIHDLLKQIGIELGRKHGTIQVSAEPLGRTPRGWKAEVAVGRDVYVFDKNDEEVTQ